MLRSVDISNLTVFPEATLTLSRALNVIVGENGAGKTHLLKVIYSVVAASFEERRRVGAASGPTKAGLQTKIADKLVGVFGPETLGRLARRRQGRERCDIRVSFIEATQNIGFVFATNSKSEVTMTEMPSSLVDVSPAYIPTRELLSIFPGFVSLYDGHYLEFEETWRDTCVLLGAPLQRGPRESRVTDLLDPLQSAMGGPIQLDRNGRFYLVTNSGRMEMPLVAEGVRKLGMVARLIATGALLDGGYLFWDEPEANLNPKLIRCIASTILAISKNGIQVFIATHSLFLLRELEILVASETIPRSRSSRPKFFGLHSSSTGVQVEQGYDVASIGDISALDEELSQSDRFIEVESLAENN